MEATGKNIHFIGIGGSGMSALAQVLLQRGESVSGSDLRPSTVTDRLVNLGARIYIGHSPDHLPGGTELVVVSTAVSQDNPEALAAREQGIRVIKRGEMLAAFMNKQNGIAVTGSHGKTTTSAMIATVLEYCGLDPTVVLGGDVKLFSGNGKLGKGAYLVAEADESDASFLYLSPYISVITNIEDDHLDYYGSMDNIRSAFLAFWQRTKPRGTSLLCLEDHGVLLLFKAIEKLKGLPSLVETITYGRLTEAGLSATDIRVEGNATQAVINFQGRRLGILRLMVPGAHNLVNSLAAVGVGLRLGLGFQEIARSLARFDGVLRRFELLGERRGIKVIDDYAHHPTEIVATIQAALECRPGRLVVVFQPHRYTRTKILKDSFGAAFEGADEVIITEIYPAGEKPIPGVSSSLIVDSISRRSGVRVHYWPQLGLVAPQLQDLLRAGDMVLIMGAGNVRQVGEQLVQLL